MPRVTRAGGAWVRNVFFSHAIKSSNRIDHRLNETTKGQQKGNQRAQRPTSVHRIASRMTRNHTGLTQIRGESRPCSTVPSPPLQRYNACIGKFFLKHHETDYLKMACTSPLWSSREERKKVLAQSVKRPPPSFANTSWSEIRKELGTKTTIKGQIKSLIIHLNGARDVMSKNKMQYMKRNESSSHKTLVYPMLHASCFRAGTQVQQVSKQSRCSPLLGTMLVAQYEIHTL